jgi:hypothetical protein
VTEPTSEQSVAVEPPVLFDTHERFSLLIHGPSKIGKSSLSGTAPKPVLVLDAEGSWRFIPVRKIYWDPVGPPPVYDGTWDACIVTINAWATVQLVYNWVSQYITPFVSIVIDSITEIQRRCKANLVGHEAPKMQDWGVLLSQMDAVIRGFRDLALIPSLNTRCVMFIAETRMSHNTGKWVPYMQGQISVSLPYWVDVCGYMYPDWEPDANGQPSQEVRRLWISPHPQYESGERVQGRLGNVITIHKPDVGRSGQDVENWMNIIFNRVATTADAPVITTELPSITHVASAHVATEG